MSRRLVTPYDEWPSREYLEYLVGEMDQETGITVGGTTSETKKPKSKKKRSRTKSTADDNDKNIDREMRRISESENDDKINSVRKLTVHSKSVGSVFWVGLP